jgi:hypothetical protein
VNNAEQDRNGVAMEELTNEMISKVWEVAQKAAHAAFLASVFDTTESTREPGFPPCYGTGAPRDDCKLCSFQNLCVL